jgi:hypothetical protein
MTTKVLPELGEYYTTHKSHEGGWVCEIVPNPSGTVRLRLRKVDLSIRWTTWIPEETE